MNLSQQSLVALLNDGSVKNSFYSRFLDNSDDLSRLYTDTAMMVSIMDYLKERLWLERNQDKSRSYSTLLTQIFDTDLSAFTFIKDTLLRRGEADNKLVKRDLELIEKRILSFVSDRPQLFQKIFLVKALENMSVVLIEEEFKQNDVEPDFGHNGPRLYRSFDKIDELFNLDYQIDFEMKIDNDLKERLYQGSGVGVQSGYSTILLALDKLKLKEGSRIVDLGSGYGRVGLVTSLLYPLINFIGYEYVAHRVNISNAASEFFDLDKNLIFIEQDLSIKSFNIPDAEVYYLYDPFTKETYKHVLKQIVEVSQRLAVTVVTKGNASDWLYDLAQIHDWEEPVQLDGGNLCLFTLS